MRVLPFLALLIGCGDASKTSDEAGEFAGDTGSNFNGDDDDDFGDDTDLPPEEEDDFLALSPAQTDVHVFVANPGRDTVTRINVLTRSVVTTSVGRLPRAVLTDPGYSYAAVLNLGDNTVTLVDAQTMDKRTVDIREGHNRMVMSPDGDWLVLWYDVDAVEAGDPEPQGLQSFNEVSIVHTPTATMVPMVVGFNPKATRFTPDAGTAVVVSDESLAVLDLTADPEDLDRLIIGIAPDPLDPPVAEEVELSPDGRFAFVRQFGADEIAVVDVTDQSVTRVPVGENPTDLDLTPDGTRAAVVARTAREIWLLRTDDPFDVPEILDADLDPDVAMGSIVFAPTGDKAVLYTTTGAARYASWDLQTDEIVLRALPKPVQSVSITPTGESVVVFHPLENAPGADPLSPFYDQPAITPISLRDFSSNPLLLPSEVTGYVNSSNGRYGFFILDGEPSLEVLDYATLLHEDVPLKSQPVYVGVLPDLDETDGDEPPSWVSQEHELGRITFYDTDDGSIETLTGFELNAEIED